MNQEFFLASCDPPTTTTTFTTTTTLGMCALLVVHCCHALRHGITGGDVTSGHCCQDKVLVPAAPRPCLVVSKLQPLGLTVTLALTDTQNLRQPGKHTYTHTHMHKAGRGHCHLPVIPLCFCTNKHTGNSCTLTKRHMATSTRGRNALGMKVNKRLWFFHMKSFVQDCMQSCVFVFFLSLSLFFLDIEMGSSQGQFTCQHGSCSHATCSPCSQRNM